MAILKDLTPGVYWCDSTGSNWKELTLEGIENNVDNVIENIKRIGISTGYKDDGERISFSVKIPTEELVEEEYNSNKNYGTFHQWHFFLAYKDIINALTDKRGGYRFRETIWTRTVYNEGNEGENNGIQWGIDLAYESSIVLWKSGKAYGIPVTIEDGVSNDSKSSYTYAEVENRAGIYYTANKPNMHETYYPLKYEYGNDSVTDKWITVSTRQKGERISFFFKPKKREYYNGVQTDDSRLLSKYQWEFLFAYKDLLDEFYRQLNSNKKPGELDPYCLPGLFLTSTQYNGKPNSIATNENKSDGVGISWAVTPSFAGSLIVIRDGLETNFLYKE